jgi:CheY-like chemotaxis protein
MQRSVMIVEDDRDTREMLERLLALEGFSVRSAENGRHALETLTAGERPCVILLDLMMPVMNGWQFRAAQVSDPALADIPVVVVSAVGHHAESIEVDAWISKPVDFDRLLTTVSGFCEREQE